jgi:predicted small lipoprotein YifL
VNAVKFLILMLALILSACGMTGELYLPEETTEKQTQDVK